jgi:transporter family protein
MGFQPGRAPSISSKKLHYKDACTMERWIVYAFISMAFAGATSVIAKLGLSGISGDLGLAIRTCFVFLFVLMFAGAIVPASELQSIGWRNIGWLAASAVTTAGSWIFYHRAIKLGDVSTVALIDKGSVVIALLLSWALLHEALTPAKLAGSALIVAGIFVIARG